MKMVVNIAPAKVLVSTDTSITESHSKVCCLSITNSKTKNKICGFKCFHISMCGQRLLEILSGV